jgi:hypothetical protein
MKNNLNKLAVVLLLTGVMITPWHKLQFVALDYILGGFLAAWLAKRFD